MVNENACWDEVFTLQRGLLVAAANNAWEKVTELARQREEVIKKILNNNRQVQEAIFKQHLQLLLDFNETFIKNVEEKKLIIIEKSNVVTQQRKASDSYLDVYTAC
jgi:hypothetical protein